MNLNPVQLMDPTSSTYTYLLWDTDTRDAVIIDPVDSQLERDLNLIAHHGLRLKYVMETHAHADHITSAAALIEHTSATAATPVGCGIQPSAIQLAHGQSLHFGGEVIRALHTPGHTAGSMCFLWRDHAFTGDTLLIGGCGRTDFQSGSARALYQSLTTVLLALPDSTTVWPGHDYQGQTHSSIGHERVHNPRLVGPDGPRDEAGFVALMDGLSLPRPKRMDEAVPANLRLGARHDAFAHQDTSAEPVAPQLPGYSGDISPQLAFEWWQSGQAVLIDIRTHAERAWVGFIPGAAAVEFKAWPAMAVNPEFDAQILASLGPTPKGSRVALLCRSGLRSVAAAQRVQAMGYVAFNILEGFEGDPDAQGHRGRLNGWRLRGLPWRQN